MTRLKKPNKNICYKDNLEMDKLQSIQCLPMLLRLYIYGLHGYFVEVTFTAIWDLIALGDWQLKGYSSIWSLAIYGTCGLALEKLSRTLRDKEIPIYFRAIIYVLVIYFWEYTSGTLLKFFGACPWDYVDFSYNIGGLITLEYAPFWLLTGILAERIILGRLEQLRWVKNGNQEGKIGEKNRLSKKSANGSATTSTNGFINKSD